MPENLLYYLPSLLGTLFSLALTIHLCLLRPGKKWGWVVFFSALVTLWCLGDMVWVGVKDLTTAVTLNRLQYLPIALVPLVWLVMALNKSGSEVLAARLLPSLLLIPAITLYLAWQYQPETGNVLWRDYILPPAVEVARVVHGPWFWLFVSYNYSIILLGCLILFRHFAQSPHYRSQMVATTAAPVAAVLFNLSYLTGIWPLPQDPTPLGFALSFGVWNWVIHRRALLYYSPVARHRALDILDDAVFILSDSGQILDYNRAAEALFPGRRPTIGDDLQQLLPGIPLLQVDTTPVPFRLSDRFYQARLTRIQRANQPLSQLIAIVQDVTDLEVNHQLLVNSQQALETANRELDRIAHTDELTGLANRRNLFVRLDQKIAEARASGSLLMVLFIDIDHFKVINDEHGHAVGDRVLRAICSELADSCRADDIAARYGGEELVLAITRGNREQALAFTRQLQQRLRELTPHTGSERPLTLTASIGISVLEGSDHSGHDLLQRADQALYRAKKNGRDQLCMLHLGQFTTL